MLKNSWSQDWGANGYFFVPIGKDSFCIERTVQTVIPIGVQFDSGIYENIGSHTRGTDLELDADKKQVISKPKKTWIVWVPIVSVIIVLAICVGIYVYLRNQKKQKVDYESFGMRAHMEVIT